MATIDFAAKGPQLGLVCQTTSSEIRFKTLTRTRLLSQPEEEQTKILSELYKENLRRLDLATHYCLAQDLHLYRLPSGLLPFFDTDTGREVFKAHEEEAARIGRQFTQFGVRLVCHPDQFVVINSASPTVRENSVRFLEMQGRMMDVLKQPRSPWAVIEIHGGAANRTLELIAAARDLPENVITRLAFENDEYSYGAAEIYEVCVNAQVPMVFDAHHHMIYEELEDFEDPSVAEWVQRSRGTWPDPSWQLAHISNGRTGPSDRSHSDLISVMPSSYETIPWIEIEAKAKEDAIKDLRSRWRPRY